MPERIVAATGLRPNRHPGLGLRGPAQGEGLADNTVVLADGLRLRTPRESPSAPTGMMGGEVPVEELGADVSAFDHEGNTAMHNATAPGDVEMINYLAAKDAA